MNQGDGMTVVLMIALLIFVMALLLFVMIRSAFADIVRTVVLAFDEYPDGTADLTIFFISDIHRRSVSRKIIDKAKGRADIVIIGGDLTEKGVPFTRVRSNLQKLIEIGPVYFIWGNNDYEVDIKKLDDLFLELDVTVLKNNSAYLPKFNNRIILIGTDYADSSESMRAILYSIRDPLFRIVLSHNPALADKVTVEDKVPLILSGHTHGGQIRIFGLGPYSKGGIKKYPWTTLLVSNGYGTSLLPLRLGVPAETHLITICKQKG